MNSVLEKYKQVVISHCAISSSTSLLDLESSDLSTNDVILAKEQSCMEYSNSLESEVDILSEIFSTTGTAISDVLIPMAANQKDGQFLTFCLQSYLLLLLLLNVAEYNSNSHKVNNNNVEASYKIKSKALEELDQLSENLLKENLLKDPKSNQASK